MDGKAAIDRFLADNPELEQLRAELARFNVFKALKVEHAEIRHSNALAWLLDPGETHGLGDTFLRRLLSNMLLETNARIEGLSAAQVELMDLGDVEVRREWQHIDVLVVIRGNPQVVVPIENKIGSGEGPGQLARYRKAISREFPSFLLLPVFLTLEGHASEDEDAADYITYSYAQVLTVLAKIVLQRRAQMPEAVGVFLDHYLATLRRLTMTDQQLVDLCKTIYRKHREAIDLIVELGGYSEFQQIAKEELEAGGCEVLASTRKTTWFLPSGWRELVPENGTAWTNLGRPVSVLCWMDHEGDERVRIIFEVSQMDDPKLRLQLVTRLSKAGFHVGRKAMSQEARYSRFDRHVHPVTDVSDEEELREAVKAVLAKAKDSFARAEKVLSSVFGKQSNRR